MVITAG